MSRRRLLGALLASVVLIPRALPAQVALQWQAGIGYGIHHILDAGTALRSTGMLLGGGLGVTFNSRYELWGEVAGGHLNSSDSTALLDQSVANAQVLAGFRAEPWLTLRAGPVFRGYSDALGHQHWTTVRVGAEAQLPLALEGMHGLLEGYWIPVASVSGLPSPETALAAGAGLDWRGKRLTVTLRYRLERYDFPGASNARRLEELSSLHLRIGMHLLQLTP